MNLDKNLKNFQITHSNELVYSKYDLSLNAQKLIMILASNVQPNDEEFKEIEFSAKDLADILDVSVKNMYKELPKITYELISKVVYFKYSNEKKQGFLQGTFLSTADYIQNEGKVILEFSPKIAPYLLQLKKLFTSYKVFNPLQFKSKYSIRLYQLFKVNEFKKIFEIEIEELKSILKTQKSYNIYNNFKEKIIKVALCEINNTDIFVTFEEIKTGRKVTALKFFIKENEKNKSKNNFKEIENKIDEIKGKKEKNIVQNEEEKEIKIDEFEDKNIKYLYELFEEKISKKNIKKIIKNAENDIEKIEKIYEYSKTQNIDNLVGFMLKMVEGNTFTEPLNEKKDNKKTDLRFNDFTQREQDYDKLENKLLGWDKDLEIEEEKNQEEFEDEDINIVQKMKRELEEEKKKEEETKYVSEIDTVKMFLEDQLTGIFGEVKYKSWLKYGVDNLDIDDKNIVHFDFKNELALKIFEKDYKDVLVELISSVEPLLQLQTNIK